jgi:MFS family permease
MSPSTRRSTAALRHRDFALFWWSSLVSNSGTWLQNVAVPFVLFRLTHSAAWVGFASFAQFAPGVVLAPLAGSLADRFSRRSVLMVNQTLLGLVALALWIEWIAGWTSPWTITATVAVSGTIASMGIASWQAFVSELVPREDLLNAVILNSTQFNAARAIGPALGGLVLGGLGPGWAFLLNAISYVFVVVALVLIRLRRSAADTSARIGILREFASTIRYVRAKRGIVACCLLITAVGLLGSPIFSLVVVFADDVFHVSGTQYGLLSACLGAGAVLGAPLLASRGPAVHRSQLVAGALLVYALALAAFGAAPGYWVGVVCLLVAGGAYLAIASTSNTTVQLQVDEVMRGKVMAFYLMTFTAAIPIGSLVQGWTAQTYGPRQTTIVAGLLLAIVVTGLRVTGRLAAMDDEGPAWNDPVDAVGALPLLDGGEMLPATVAVLEDGTPAARRAGLEERHDPTGPQLEPTVDRVDDADRR